MQFFVEAGTVYQLSIIIFAMKFRETWCLWVYFDYLRVLDYQIGNQSSLALSTIYGFFRTGASMSGGKWVKATCALQLCNRLGTS